MTQLKDSAIPQGSTVLVTGVNGFLGSHIADQFLQRGFKVRGTVRDASRNAWLETLFAKEYDATRFELWQIPDMSISGSLDGAAKGVTAIVHTASIMSLDHDPNMVIPGAIAFALNALKVAYSEHTVKRFVYCSSSTAAILSQAEKPGIVVTEKTWNEDAVKEAWADPPYFPERSHAVYSASKTLAEQSIWKYHDDHHSERPDLVVNSEYFVDVQDVGRLHVAAVLLEKVRSERIFAFAARYNWDAVLGILRELEPRRTFPDNFSGGEDPNEIQPRYKAEGYLRDLGRPGWTSLEESVHNMVVQFQELEDSKTD